MVSWRNVAHEGSFPNDESVFRLIFLGLKPVSQKWTMPIKNWKMALQQLALLFEEQLPIDGLSVIIS